MQCVRWVVRFSGLGVAVQTIVIGAQAAATPEQLALVTANTNFWQQIGSVLGIAITSSVFSNKLTDNLAIYAPNASVAFVKNSPSLLRNAPVEAIPPSELDGVLTAYVKALSLIFLLTAPFAAMMILGGFFMKKGKLPKGVELGVAA
ncbi:hypothetical protein HDU93_009342 [Gonapodya sp. JEL0774]|nr:hypothetical protein HDU93_009342 [Gonapodya sp. JEL0774]